MPDPALQISINEKNQLIIVFPSTRNSESKLKNALDNFFTPDRLKSFTHGRYPLEVTSEQELWEENTFHLEYMEPKRELGPTPSTQQRGGHTSFSVSDVSVVGAFVSNISIFFCSF
tara:strand:- start:1366 stop:1713 length:348 start_codon:yes stop_codon:yes gene_type:complete